jgi:hypothetical protein
MNIEINNEMKVIALLSEYVGKLKQGLEYETTTFETAKKIDSIYNQNESKKVIFDSNKKGRQIC